MIRITLDPETPALSAAGHAGSGPKGEDLVCAGVTALLLTLERIVLEAGGAAHLEPGKAELRGNGRCRREFLGICRGLMLMAERFPEAVNFRKLGG